MSSWRTEAGLLGRYLGAGSVNTLVGFAVIFLLMWLGLSAIAANVAGYAVGFVLGFVLSKKMVFRSDGHFVVESLRYLLAFITSFIVNLLVLYASLDALGQSRLLAQIVAAASYTMMMYLLTRLFVFIPPKS